MGAADARSGPKLPGWAAEVVARYQSHTASQFVLYGNIHDRFLLPLAERSSLGSLTDFLLKALMPRFDVVLSYDLGNGIRVESGGPIFNQWPALRDHPSLPASPREAVETLGRYFRYCANLALLGKTAPQVGCWIRSAHLVVPASQGYVHHDLNAVASLIRDWASEDFYTRHPLVTCLLVDNLNDLHPLLANNPRAATIKVPLPAPGELEALFSMVAPEHKTALSQYDESFDTLAQQLGGTTLSAAENLLKLKEYRKEPLRPADMVHLKKELVEQECHGLVEFIQTQRTLDDLHAQDALKKWLRDDIALWRQGDLKAMPMGYLICGPVGTGKTFMVECLAGEAGVPVVKIKNFRDKWVGSTEGNLETIFRLIQSLGRCFVFIDEADQALGKRESGGHDGGLSGRVYSMFAKEMSNPDNRGRVIWILASSRPDLIEVDLKRPGRIDVKIPIFPTTSPAESAALLRALCRRWSIELSEDDLKPVQMPILLTAGAAEALALKIYRLTQVDKCSPPEAARLALADYQPPVPRDVLERQIELAVSEATDITFVPPVFRTKAG